ncbi:hypothetical protein SteCoe_3993 [Stentor coeruleus]|uniref:C2 domain-containing protein n=1 Tax=Stentor coeruleus TaxID=5963 RepID=A0A1R2BXU6_9CILI|nr:hypothetical protein SteCoe_17915 [Stentor coeruleus]OMJ93054.1 hypothetical protein SteCoe_3993 [Stentor coeruleus]
MEESCIQNIYELILSAKNIPEKDDYTNTNPLCIVYENYSNSHKKKELGRTEIIRNSLSPNWKTPITISYTNIHQIFLNLYIFHSNDSELDLLLTQDINLEDLVFYEKLVFEVTESTFITIKIIRISNPSEAYFLKFKGEDLSKATLSPISPYLVLYRNLDENTWVEVYKTEIIKNTQNPVWSSLGISAKVLCACNRNLPIKIICFDNKNIGKDMIIGESEVTLEQLIICGFSFKLFDIKNKTLNTVNGIIYVEYIELGGIPKTITECINTYLELSFVVAVDFSSQINQVSDKNPLHFYSKACPNEFEIGLRILCEFFAKFNEKKNYHALGFGGIEGWINMLPGTFPLSLNCNMEIIGTENLIDIYKGSSKIIKSARNNKLDGPLTYTANLARESIYANKNVYSILVIFTYKDYDIDNICDLLVENAGLPLSIMIVGVGTAEFYNFSLLNREGEFLTNHENLVIERKITHFLSLSSDENNLETLLNESEKALTAQILEYVERKNDKPIIR